MENSKLSDVKGKELVAAGHAFAKAIGMDTQLIEVAKMVSELETRLDCAMVRGDELQKERDALAAENVGMDKFVDSMLSIAWQGGSADGADIQELALNHGLIRQESYCADTHESLVEDPGNFEEGDEVYFRVETPATDAYINSVRAEGIEILTGKLQQLIDEGVFDAKEIGVAAGAVHEGAQIAAQLRAGEPS